MENWKPSEIAEPLIKLRESLALFSSLIRDAVEKEEKKLQHLVEARNLLTKEDSRGDTQKHPPTT